MHTYKSDYENDKTVRNTDDLTAIKQAICKILNTQRYENPIYSSNYGIELKDLYSLPADFVQLELKTKILSLSMVVDIENTKINGVASNLTLESEQIPIFKWVNNVN